jgi:hypothetical protein
LSVVKKHLGEDGGSRKRFTMPAVVNAFLRLAHQFLEPNAEVSICHWLTLKEYSKTQYSLSFSV